MITAFAIIGALALVLIVAALYAACDRGGRHTVPAPPRVVGRLTVKIGTVSGPDPLTAPEPFLTDADIRHIERDGRLVVL